ncbi:MAG: Apolipoprotein N-acyltransferase [Myxococcaceae bacterium]|nr:Apolipoprotein N-acyltransferase [Myxococcaceae bacterium]
MFDGMRAQRVAPLLVALSGGAVLLAPNEPRLLALTGFIGLLALCEALERVSADTGRSGILRAARCGLVFGTAANACALFSLIELLGSFARLPAVLAALLALLAWLAQGLVFALAAGLSHYLHQAGSPRWLTLPSALMLSLGSVPALFPWHVAATQVGFLPFVQLAELGGESLVGLLLCVAACSLHALLRATGSSRYRLAAVAAAAVVLPVCYGLVRLQQVRQLRAQAPTLQVGVVQSNVGMAQKHSEASARDNLQGLRSLTRQLEARGVELTVWAETAYPYPLLRSAVRAPEDIRRVLGDGVHGPVLLGLETYDGFEDTFSTWNSAWLVRRDGSFGARVDKTQLLPFGEYIPFWDWLPSIKTRFARRGFTHGVPGTIETERGKLGVLICYEDLFASSARATVLLGARALLNLTNDAWFGDSREPLLHDQLARLRSIELRRDLVRAVNTGVSSFTSATGEVLLQTRTFERASFAAAVRLLDEQTLYARFGDWPLVGCLLTLGICALWRRRSGPLASARASGSSAD